MSFRLGQGLRIHLSLSLAPKTSRKGGDRLLKKTRGCRHDKGYVKSESRHPQGWSMSVKNPWVICVKTEKFRHTMSEQRA